MSRRPSELVLNQLHAAMEQSALTEKALATCASTLQEQGPDTLESAVAALLGAAAALNESIYRLYTSEVLLDDTPTDG